MQMFFRRNEPRRTRLYLHIYFAILGIILLFVALTALTFMVFNDDLDDAHKARSVSLITAALLPLQTHPCPSCAVLLSIGSNNLTST